jgi:hypothetical protein
MTSSTRSNYYAASHSIWTLRPKRVRADQNDGNPAHADDVRFNSVR